MYLLFALPHGGVHAILGLIGIFLILTSYYKFKRMKQYRIESYLNIVGLVLLLLSIVFFFYNDKDGYNYQTFDQTGPLVTMILFVVVSVFYLIDNLKSSSFSQADK